MKYVLFSIYYVKLQASVAAGFHKTASPLSVGWRWRYWNRRYGTGRRI